jgi:hypothetical protein
VYGKIATVLLDGVLRQYRTKSCNCDCWPGLCSYGATDSCRWLTIRSALLASSRHPDLLAVD